MSFNKKIIPEPEVLITYLKEYGSNSFYIRYIKNVDAMMGNSEGIDYIEEFETKYYNRNENDPEFYELD
jgi:hypothetical protein